MSIAGARAPMEELVGSILNMIDTIKKTLKVFNRKQQMQFIIYFLLQITGAVLELFGISMLLPIITVLIEPNELMENELMQPFLKCMHLETAKELTLFLLAALCILFIIKNVYFAFMLYAQYQILWHNEIKTEIKIMQIYMRQPYLFHTKKNTAELQRTILIDIGNVFLTMKNILLLVADIITCLMIAIVLFINNWAMSFILVILLMIFLLLYFKVFKKRLYLYGKLGQKYGGDSVKCINQAFGGIKDVKIYQCEDFFVEDYRGKRVRQISMMKRGEFFQAVPRYFLEVICIVSVLFPVFIMTLIDVELTGIVSQLAVFAGAAYKMMPTITRINSELSYLMNCKASVDLVYDVIQETKETKETVSIENDVIDLEPNASIKFENVYFGYERDKAVLQNVNLCITPGKSVAFIGPSGAGKTTLADLLLGILQPDAGKILYGGEDISRLKGAWLSKVGYIPQNIYMSDDTIRNNIAFGKKEIDDKKVWKALKEAQLEEFIKENKEGLDLIIGETGVRISGGQRQRIGIARALYDDPEILVLDEATSALDNETEKAVMESINYLKGKKTLLIIAHRLTTIENCDEIYEVKDGKVKKQR